MWLLCVVQYARLAVVHSMGLWLPTFLVLEKGYSLRVAGLYVAVSAAATGPANFVGGYLADRTGRPVAVIAVALLVLTITTAALVPVATPAALAAVVGINGLVVQIYFGPLFSIPLEVFGTSLGGLATGLGNLCANLGGLSFVLLLGVLRDRTGSFDPGLYALSALCLLALGCVACLSMLLRHRPTTVPRATVRP
jgi:sugar phosphate permease